jgi:hypothetical protein
MNSQGRKNLGAEVMKGHGFSRAISGPEAGSALAAEGVTPVRSESQ